MSWSRRRALLAGIGTLVLSGCFRPMLAQDAAARALRHRIALPEVDSRFGHFLVRSLEDRLGEPRDPDLRLEIETELEDRGIAVAQNDAITRVILLAEARWALWRTGDSEPVIRELAVSESSYNATSSLFATRQLRRDIEQRLARDLGQRIALAILARAEELTA